MISDSIQSDMLSTSVVHTTCMDPGIMDSFTCNSGNLEGDYECRDILWTLACPDSSRAIVRPHAVGNPLLRAIHNIDISFPFGGSSDTGNIGAR